MSKQPAFQTPAEIEAIKATEAAIAAGLDPFGDDDDESQVVTVTTDEADDDTADEGDEADETKDKPAAKDDTPADDAATEDSTDEVAKPEVPRFDAGDPSKYAEQRKALRAEKATALKELMDGVIDPATYSEREEAISDKLDALAVQSTLHEANQQTEAQIQAAALSRIMDAAKAAKQVDYRADSKAALQFDMALNMILADPDNQARPYAENAADAHKAVLALRGVAKKADVVAEPAKPAAEPRENGKAPMTLRNVPAAAPTQGADGGWMEQLGKLKGQQYEEAFARLTPAQKSALMGD